MRWTIILIVVVTCVFYACEEAEKDGSNTPPTLSITAPTDNGYFYFGDAIYIEADVIEGDGDITEVCFYGDDDLIGCTKDKPYSIVWYTDSVIAGVHEILIIAFDDEGDSVEAIVHTNIMEAVAPTPEFVIVPSRGNTTTIFSIDASQSSDYEDQPQHLQVRWDFDSDGIWDQDYSTEKIVSHQFDFEGEYSVTLEIRDSHDLVSRLVKNVLVVGDGTVTDIDGNVYPTVVIGSQEWMLENLMVIRYRNGDSLSIGLSNGEWQGISTGAAAAYENNIENSAVYGFLYNWHAVMDERVLAPEGWRVPTHSDMLDLIEYLGDGNDVGGKLKEAGSEHWKTPNTGATNESGFTALPGGSRDSGSGYFDDLTEDAVFWTSTYSYSGNGPLSLILGYGHDGKLILSKHERSGFSIRCIRDE